MQAQRGLGGLSQPQGHGLVGRKYVTEKSSDTPGNRSRDRPRLVAQRLNHYATPGPPIHNLDNVNKCKILNCIPTAKFDYVINTVKGKAIPLQAWTGPEGSSRLRPQISRQSAHEGGKVVSPTHRPTLPPRKYSWCSFLLEAESTPGP